MGLHFENCNPFLLELDFENCLLNHSSFSKLKLKKTRFINCNLQEVDFTGCDLSQALLDQCDLNRTVFEGTILEKADLRTSFNYSIDPELNRMKKARFSINGVAGLLYKYDIDLE